MANVVLTFGQDNSPKVDPADNVLYRDIDLGINASAIITDSIQATSTIYGTGEEQPSVTISGFIATIDVSNTDATILSVEYQPTFHNWDQMIINPRILLEYNELSSSVSAYYSYITTPLYPGYPTTNQFVDVTLIAYLSEKIKAGINKYTVKQLVDINSVANCLNNIFSWTPGERVLYPEFGANLRKMLFEGITTQNSELIRAEVQNAIAKYEPRKQLENIFDISTTTDTENNTVALRIVYSVPTLPGQRFTYDYFALKR